MCLFPRIIENKRYLPNKQNGGFVPTPSDERLRAVSIGCGKCIECRKQKARDWGSRLSYEIRDDDRGRFMTMTFSDESLEAFQDIDPNEVAGKAIELFRKRWYAKYKEGIKHWLVTELGHEGTERLHIHGFLWTEKTAEEIEIIWSYGWIDTGEYVNEKSINYCIKYVSKVDEKHPEFISKIFASKGLGKGFFKRPESKINKFNGKNTIEYIRTQSGHKVRLPMYYRNKLYNEEEKEKLRLQTLDKEIVYINKHKINISTKEGIKNHINALKQAQQFNFEMGYPKNPWSRKKYKKSRKKFGL